MELRRIALPNDRTGARGPRDARARYSMCIRACQGNLRRGQKNSAASGGCPRKVSGGLGCICTAHGIALSWTSFDGVPIINRYYQPDLKNYNFPLNGRRVRVRWAKGDTDEVKEHRARNSITANFVHSLDAAHLRMVALAAKAEGIDMLRIHDSFAFAFAGTQGQSDHPRAIRPAVFTRPASSSLGRNEAQAAGCCSAIITPERHLGHISGFTLSESVLKEALHGRSHPKSLLPANLSRSRAIPYGTSHLQI
jgi:DNA-dependent RNA polymerase